MKMVRDLHAVTTKFKPSQYASSAAQLSNSTMASCTMFQLFGVSRLTPFLTYALVIGRILWMSGWTYAVLCPAIDMPLVMCIIVETVDENLKDFELNL